MTKNLIFVLLLYFVNFIVLFGFVYLAIAVYKYIFVLN